MTYIVYTRLRFKYVDKASKYYNEGSFRKGLSYLLLSSNGNKVLNVNKVILLQLAFL